MRIFIDMDGVLADFIAGIEGPDYLDGMLLGEEMYDDRKYEFIHKRLFKNLPPMEDMYDLMLYIKKTKLDYEILTCTGQIERQLVHYDKVAWIKEHVDPFVIVNSTLKGKHKAAFAAPNHVLIDDKAANIKAWEEAGGKGIFHVNAMQTILKLHKWINDEK